MFSEAVKNKLSCAAFFFLPGLSYSLVTSRMPAIKESAQIDDLQLGIALFCLGIAGCIGLFFSSRLVRLLKDRPTIAAGASLSTIGLVIAGYANSFASLVSGFAVIIFGMRALLVTAVSVIASVAFEWLYCKLLKKPNPISDLSAVVTGIILAMNVPVGMPIGQLIIGDLVAIIIVKQLFGGIGMNFANPALVGRIVLFISFASSMNNWVFPDAAVDQLSSATPLAVADKSKLSLLDLFMGIHGGVLGETCALAIVLGLVYLVATKTISIAIPASYVGSMFVFYLIATRDLHAALAAVLSGGLLFGAVFMATDYVTSPFTLKGKLVYGVALGIVTFAIRYWGSYTEGVSFALLFMNLWVPYINDLTRQTPYGYVKPAKKAKEGADK